MRINNRNIVLQGSGTINEGSGTPLSVPLTSGSSFNPKIFVQYTLEIVDDNVYPFSSTNRPVKYILCVYSHVKNYKPGTNEYSYFDAMDKVFYYMIHNDTCNNYGAYKFIGNTTRIFTPDNIDLYVNTNDKNAAYISDLGEKSYNFDRLSALLNSNNGLHPSDAPLNYLNFLPEEITKIKNALGDDKNGLIIDTACIKSPKEDYTNTFYADGFLTKSNCIVSLSLTYPKEFNANIIVCNNTLIVKKKASDTDILGRITVGSDDVKYYITGNMDIELGLELDITGNIDITESVKTDNE